MAIYGHPFKSTMKIIWTFRNRKFWRRPKWGQRISEVQIGDFCCKQKWLPKLVHSFFIFFCRSRRRFGWNEFSSYFIGWVVHGGWIFLGWVSQILGIPCFLVSLVHGRFRNVIHQRTMRDGKEWSLESGKDGTKTYTKLSWKIIMRFTTWELVDFQHGF